MATAQRVSWPNRPEAVMATGGGGEGTDLAVLGMGELVDEGRLRLEVGHRSRHMTGRAQCLADVRKRFIQGQVSDWCS